MNYKNYDDVVGQLQGAGLIIKDGLAIDSHKFVRCSVEGGDREKRGWYKLFTLGDLISGAFGIWSADNPQSFKVELPKAERKALNADELAAIKAKQEADRKRAEAERQREIEAAAAKAGRWWKKLADAGESGYMAKKGFGAGELFGARISPSGNLVVPVQDGAGKTYGLQVISPAKGRNGRDKDFTPPGLAKKGHYFQIGAAQRGGVVLLCEGFATGASLAKATGLPVVVAFDAGNLLPCAQNIHKAHRKDIHILVCADDDYFTAQEKGRNPGLDAARATALAVDGAVAFPVFPEERPTDRKGPTDFNDLHVHPAGGLQAVRQQIEAAIASAGWKAPRPRAAGVANAGGGGSDGRPDAVAVMSLNDAVERFIPIDDGRGKCMFDTWTNKLCLREHMMSILPAGVRGDDVKRHPLYIERGAFYLDQIGFDPTESDKYVKLNTWAGWPMKPKAGDCKPFLELIEQQCSDERNSREVYNYLLDWMAYPLQNAGAKMNTAIIMHGPQGTGKSMIFKALAQIYGKGHPFRDYSVVLDQRALQDNFNADWENKLFVLTEEAVNSGDKWTLKNELKELVTGDRLRIRKVFTDAYYQKNQLNMVFLSNEGQPLPLDHDDRRHLVVWTPPQKEAAYYKNVQRCLDDGGLEAFYHFLMERDLSAFNPKDRPPNTAAKEELIYQSAPTDARFIADWKAGMLDVPFCPCGSEDLYEVYVHWCRRNGERFVIPQNRFFGFVRMSPGWKKGVYRTHAAEYDQKQSKSRRLIIPSEMDLTKAAKESGVDFRKDAAETEVDWHSRCYFEFSKKADAARLSRSPMREAA